MWIMPIGYFDRFARHFEDLLRCKRNSARGFLTFPQLGIRIVRPGAIVQSFSGARPAGITFNLSAGAIQQKLVLFLLVLPARKSPSSIGGHWKDKEQGN